MKLQQAINKATAASIMHSERPGNRLFGLGSRFLMHDEYISLDESLERTRAITEDDIAAAARKYLSNPPKEILAIG